MNEIELKNLWDSLQSKYDVGTFEEFKTKMSDAARRKNFFNIMTKKGVNLGDSASFEKLYTTPTKLKSQSPVNTNSGGTTVNQTTYNYNGTNTDKTVDYQSSTKDCNDFPFTLGCINDLIGDINEKIFGTGRRMGNVYSKSLQNILNNRAYFGVDNKDMSITNDIWNDIMKNAKSDIIKETVKKVLKERILKK